MTRCRGHRPAGVVRAFLPLPGQRGRPHAGACAHRQIPARRKPPFCNVAGVLSPLFTYTAGIPMDADLVRQIDEWCRRQPDLPNRAEAIRRLVKQALAITEDPDAPSA